MSRAQGTLPPDYFEALYARDADPWQFETSGYECAKYAATLAALPEQRFRSALEVGCSVGVLTERLAPRCDDLLALDISDLPLERARLRCRDLPQVRFARMQVPAQWPDGAFDLILLSEVLYYLDRDDLARLAARVQASLDTGGVVVMVHWIGETDYPLSGDAAVEGFIAQLAPGTTTMLARDRTPRYRLDALRLAQAE